VTQPRAIFPGTTFMLTRRCTQRQFWLSPTRLAKQIWLYALAYCAQKHEILIHCFNVLSNHHHVEGTDERGTLPDFARDFHRLVAAATNASYARWENLFDNAKASYVTLFDEAAVREKTAYILTNPVKDDLVARARHWPGAWTPPRLLAGGKLRVKRPPIFFSKTMPEELVLELTIPPAFAHMDPREYRAMVARDVAAVEREREAVRTRTGRRVLGKKAILRQSPSDRPKTREPRRQLSPRVMAIDKWKRIEALQQNAAFLAAYHQAHELWRAGDHSALFPYGTFLLARCHCVRVHAPP
jgi:putative transposase